MVVIAIGDPQGEIHYYIGSWRLFGSVIERAGLLTLWENSLDKEPNSPLRHVSGPSGVIVGGLLSGDINAIQSGSCLATHV